MPIQLRRRATDSPIVAGLRLERKFFTKFLWVEGPTIRLSADRTYPVAAHWSTARGVRAGTERKEGGVQWSGLLDG